MRGLLNLNKPTSTLWFHQFQNLMMTKNSNLLNVITITLKCFRNELEHRSIKGFKFKQRYSSILEKKCQEK